MWLDGRPQALRLAKSMAGLLIVQGIRLAVPRDPGQPVYGEVCVIPPEGSPDYRWALEAASKSGCRGLVGDVDPERALYKALHYPGDGFMQAVIGVDPGRECAASAIADGVLVWMWRGRCASVGLSIKGFLDKASPSVLNIFLGSGPSFEEAEYSLALAGLSYTIVEEWGTTSMPYDPPGGVYTSMLDKDLLASLTIAYRGLVGWRGRASANI